MLQPRASLQILEFRSIMAKMFKNLKSLFVIEEEDPAEQQTEAPAVKPSTKSSPPPKTEGPAAGPTVSESKAGDPGKVTQQFTNVLFKAMNQNNLDGFDYLEYKQSLNSLKKMPMDEPTRYQSAFAMAQTMGATPAGLLQTAQHYVDVLKQEEQKFDQAVSKQQQLQIGSKEQAINKLEETIKAKAEQIKRLTQEIEQHQKEREQLTSEIKEAVVKVESTRNDFIASYNNLVSQIHEDMENIKKYLK